MRKARWQMTGDNLFLEYLQNCRADLQNVGFVETTDFKIVIESLRKRPVNEALQRLPMKLYTL